MTLPQTIVENVMPITKGDWPLRPKFDTQRSLESALIAGGEAGGAEPPYQRAIRHSNVERSRVDVFCNDNRNEGTRSPRGIE